MTFLAAIRRAFTALSLVPLLAAAAEPAAVRVVRLPDGGLQPKVQTDARGRTHLIYFKGDPKHGDVFYVRSEDGGTTFTPPLRVNSQAESAVAIGTVRGPHLALGKGDRVHVAWMGSDRAEPKIGGKAPMLYTRLDDAGDAFEAQRNVIVGHPGLDGGGAVAADAEGNVYVAWHAPERGGAGEADRRVWVARSSDDGKTFAPESAASPPATGACGCCGMNVEAADGGRVYVLYRTASEMVNRDMDLLASDDHGKTFKVAHSDPWRIGTCAMSTSAFAPAGGAVLAAWETQGQIRVARIAPADPAAAKPLSVPGKGGERKHPAVAVNRKGEWLVAWAEGTGWNKGGSVAWQVFDKDGEPEAGNAGRADGLPAWDAPAAFAAPDDTFRITF